MLNKRVNIYLNSLAKYFCQQHNLLHSPVSQQIMHAPILRSVKQLCPKIILRNI